VSILSARPDEAGSIIDEIRASHSAYAGAIPCEPLQDVFQGTLVVVKEVAGIRFMRAEDLHSDEDCAWPPHMNSGHKFCSGFMIRKGPSGIQS